MPNKVDSLASNTLCQPHGIIKAVASSPSDPVGINAGGLPEVSVVLLSAFINLF